MSQLANLPQEQDAAIAELNRRLGELKVKAEIEIVDQQSLLASANAKLDLESYIKSVDAHFAPEVERASRIKITMAALMSPAKDWLKSLVGRQRDFAAEEKRKAAEEERRINEEARAAAAVIAAAEQAERDRIAAEERRAAELQAARNKRIRDAEIEEARKAGVVNKREADKLKKAAEEQAARDRQAAAKAEQREKARAAEDAKTAVANAPVVTVTPDLPRGGGLPRNQTFYFAEVTDSQAIIRAYETAKDPVRIAFLRRFIQVNEQEVGKYSRDTKDPEKVMAQLPGVKAWSKG
jgi:septal ring factor EnvC (AmiA/AmiB activator)